ncbi:carbohydrate ABC transporter permease [Actinomadura scrupuli]|uniref:carbohydrate ABC transporter permease n=1 Tax=Actinomadura scrupuli TaxID=559629 RepID=UPI003D960440
MMTDVRARRPRTESAPEPVRQRGNPDRIGAERPGVFGWLLLAALAGFGLVPIYWMLVTSVTPDADAIGGDFHLFPARLTAEHFANFFRDPQLMHFLLNSLLVSGATALLGVGVATYMAYSFSKFRYRGRGSLMTLVFTSQLFPGSLLLISLYVLFQNLGLLFSYTALVLSFSTFTLPLCVFVLKGFFDAIPDEVIEAAKVDGASQWTIIHRVLLPMLGPGLVAAALFAFIRGWNDFIFALTLGGPDKQTLPPGLVRTYMTEAQANWPDLMAASLIVSAPVVVLFILLQRFLVAGLSAGAVKG